MAIGVNGGIGPNTQEIGIGPINFDVEMARKGGLTEAQVAAAWERLREIGHELYRKGHARGRVKTCSCVACDQRVKMHELPEEYKAVRRRWSAS